jgi:hypothetical protein
MLRGLRLPVVFGQAPPDLIHRNRGSSLDKSAQQAEGVSIHLDSEPLCQWFDDATAGAIRAIEVNLRHLLVGDLVTSHADGHLDRISSVASTLYVALFATCRRAAAIFRSSNPTWLKSARKKEDRVALATKMFTDDFEEIVSEMAASLTTLTVDRDRGSIDLYLGNSTDKHVQNESIDFVLTSPPYCTRIDYTSATRVELAVVAPLLVTSFVELGRHMIGSTRVPRTEIEVRDHWGPTCLSLISDITSHRSKASAGYYRKTHIDYFDKIDRSVARISLAMKAGSGAVMVVQDSYYKEIHNDLPTIFTEIAACHSLIIKHREDFYLPVTIAARHPHAGKYDKPNGATESVLCFLEKVERLGQL